MKKLKTTEILKKDFVIALGCGAIATIVMLLGTYIIGFVSQYQAKELIGAIMPTIRFLCSAIMTASATIIALMLTLLGYSFNMEKKFADEFFQRIKVIAFYDTVILAFSTSLLVLHCFPIMKSVSVPSSWYFAGYYFLLISSTILGGGLVSLVTLLYLTIKETIISFGYGDDNGRYMAIDEENEEKGSSK